MALQTDRPEDGRRARIWRDLSRRQWMTGALCAASACASPIGSSVAWAAQGEAPRSEAQEIADVDALAKQKGLGKFARSRTEHFIAMGDAPQKFCDAALGICESLTVAFMGYFKEKGFKLALPKDRMTVITLKDDASYRAWAGDDPGAIVGGHYDLDTNRLVIFDFRPKREELGVNPEQVNLRVLVHETAHMLSFNTGMLSRQAAKVPDWVSEGLATHVEVWQKRPPKKIGSVNLPWLTPVRASRNAAGTWVPIADLVKSDDAIWDPKTQQLANGESWLLFDYLMKERLPKLRAYLEAVNKAPKDADREQLFEQHIESLKKTAEQVDRYMRRLRG
jgi:Protein of unknown function (DUF1570)